jgi:hypothetical protein
VTEIGRLNSWSGQTEGRNGKKKMYRKARKSRRVELRGKERRKLDYFGIIEGRRRK